MASENEKLLDEIGRELLRALQEDARQSFADLARIVKLSPPAVAERVRRMEDAGIITGYHAEVDAGKIGQPLTVFIHLRTTPDMYPRIIKIANERPEVLECYHVAGGESFIMKMVLATMPHLEDMIKKLSAFGSTSTNIILSAPVRKHVLDWASEEIGPH